MRRKPSLAALLALLAATHWGCAQGGGPQSFRLGAGVDLVAFERSEERTRLSLFDLKLMRIFDYERGPERSGVGFMESPIFKLFASRTEGEQHELRVLDFRILAFFRNLRTGTEQSELQILQLPLLGSLYGLERQGDIERRSILFFYSGQSTRTEEEPEPSEPPPSPEPTTSPADPT